MIKSRLTTVKEKNKYPYISEFVNIHGQIIIVLFSSYGIGTCIYSTNPESQVGEYSAAWGEREFKTIEGSVVLSNE